MIETITCDLHTFDFHLIWNFVENVWWNMKQTQQDLELLEQACDQLKSSRSLVKILEMVLAVGNHLNGGSFRGAARGFKLDALLKLMDVKGRNKKTTLLHFVVSELLKTDPQVRSSPLSLILMDKFKLLLEPNFFV